MDSVTLGYWGIRGLAQPLRFLLNYLGIKFEDKRYNDGPEWHEKDKLAFGDEPYINLPYLKFGDKVYFESDALFYAVAHHAGRPEIVGKDSEHAIRVAQARGVVKDIQGQFVSLVYDKENFEKRKPQVLQNISSKFATLEKVLSQSQWLTGDQLTYVDFLFFEYIDELKAFDEKVLEQFPRVQDFYKRFTSIPQNQEYMSRADYIARPFNSPVHAAFY